MNYARVILGARLTRTPETTYTKTDNMAIVKFGVAWDSGYGDKKKPCFADVTMFGKRGEAFAKFHEKGSPCFIEGDLRFDQWEDKKTGEKRSKLYIVGNEWQFVGSKKDRPADEEPSAVVTTDSDESESVPF